MFHVDVFVVQNHIKFKKLEKVPRKLSLLSWFPPFWISLMSLISCLIVYACVKFQTLSLLRVRETSLFLLMSRLKIHTRVRSKLYKGRTELRLRLCLNRKSFPLQENDLFIEVDPLCRILPIEELSINFTRLWFPPTLLGTIGIIDFFEFANCESEFPLLFWGWTFARARLIIEADRESMETDLLIGCISSTSSFATSQLLLSFSTPPNSPSSSLPILNSQTSSSISSNWPPFSGISTRASSKGPEFSTLCSGDGAPAVLETIPARHIGQFVWELSQVSIQGMWKAWLHLGRRRTASSSSNSAKQTEHSVPSTRPSPLLYLQMVIALMTDGWRPTVRMYQMGWSTTGSWSSSMKSSWAPSAGACEFLLLERRRRE